MRTNLPLALFASLLVACGKEPVAPPEPEKLIAKTVTFQVFAAGDYSDPIYANTMAEVNLEISAVDLKTGKSTLVWDTTFNRRSLNLYPQHGAMYVVEKTVPVYERIETINAGYWIRYDTDGQVQQEGSGEGLIQGVKSLRMEVSL